VTYIYDLIVCAVAAERYDPEADDDDGQKVDRSHLEPKIS